MIELVKNLYFGKTFNRMLMDKCVENINLQNKQIIHCIEAIK